jgi:hypothetical protein
LEDNEGGVMSKEEDEKEEKKVREFVRYLFSKRSKEESVDIDLENLQSGLPIKEDFLYTVFNVLDFFRNRLPNKKLPGSMDEWCEFLEFCFGEPINKGVVAELFGEYWPDGSKQESS